VAREARGSEEEKTEEEVISIFGSVAGEIPPLFICIFFK
jgi:hypothetical protein